MQTRQPFEESLIALGRQLRSDGYRFVTPTPATHARVLRRDRASATLLHNIFGWNRPFAPEYLPPPYRSFLDLPALFTKDGGGVRAQVRFSTLDGLLLAHSGFPATEQDAVFLGPDTYRFCRAITGARDREPGFCPRRIFDIGTGSGAGGLYAAGQYPSLREIVLTDVNPRALAFSRANAILNDVPAARICLSDILDGVEGDGDLIICNPPYLVDRAHRTYRDGGGTWGDLLAARILQQALGRLSPGGRLLLYTGSPIVDGHDMFLAAAEPILRPLRDYRYEECDPDVFGEELESPPYDRADRIATVVLHVKGEDIPR